MAQIVKNKVTITTGKKKKRLWESCAAPFCLGKNREKSTIFIAQDVTGTISTRSSQPEINNSYTY